MVSSRYIEIGARGQAESVEVRVVSHLSDGFHMSHVILGTWR